MEKLDNGIVEERPIKIKEEVNNGTGKFCEAYRFRQLSMEWFSIKTAKKRQVNKGKSKKGQINKETIQSVNL